MSSNNLIPFPPIDPVALRIGPLSVRWYGIAYLLGFLSGYWVLRTLAGKRRLPLRPEQVGDFLSWLIVGLVAGARLGYVLFYNLAVFAQHPLRIFALWEGGMSFHGGLLGVTAATYLYGRKNSLSFLRLTDALAVAVSPGLFFGRIANFINAELYGRASNLPWAMVFPGAGPTPRHPSQLYEALLEGPILWQLALWMWSRHADRPGATTAAFLAGYGVLRFLVEFSREPDSHLEFIVGFLTMGQILSCGLIAGAAAVWFASRTNGRT